MSFGSCFHSAEVPLTKRTWKALKQIVRRKRLRGRTNSDQAQAMTLEPDVRPLCRVPNFTDGVIRRGQYKFAGSSSRWLATILSHRKPQTEGNFPSNDKFFCQCRCVPCWWRLFLDVYAIQFGHQSSCDYKTLWEAAIGCYTNRYLHYNVASSLACETVLSLLSLCLSQFICFVLLNCLTCNDGLSVCRLNLDFIWSAHIVRFIQWFLLRELLCLRR